MKPSTIVIDGRMFQQSGIGRYIRNLIFHLQILDKENEYFILHLKDDYQHLQYNNNFHKVMANFSWYGISEQVKLLRLFKSLKPDLVHFPHFNVPILYRGKFVVTIHDLIHQHFQMRRATTLIPFFYRIKQMGYNAIFRNAVEKSDKILVPSNYVKSLLLQEWQISQNKVLVTYEGIDDKILAIVNKKDDSKKILQKFNIKKPYIFYVGNAHPHKNVEGLIRVFEKLKDRVNDLSLVLSGNDHYFWQRIKMMYRHDSIFYTGNISDEELVGLYKNAECFIMPSFEEGFGIPILEAMVCACPVVSSNTGSLLEVGGNAASYFDPKNQESMYSAITQVLTSESLRKSLIAQGKTRVKLFGWEKLAKQTLEVYLQCM